MKKIIVTIFTITLFLSVHFVGLQNTKANVLADSADIFNIVTPAPNSKVKGNTDISIRIYDDEQSSVAIQSNIFDRTTCNSTNYGATGSVSNLPSNPGVNGSFSWNSTSTSSTTNLPDGVYCLKICAYFLNNGEGYSVCNGREIQIVNNNSLPTITSQLGKTSYLEGESFQYQLTASDSDSDVLTYRFVSAPDILSINKTTGLITSGPLSTLGYAGLEYTVTIAVSDGISGEATQTFKFNVVKPTPPAQPQQPQTPEQPEQPQEPETPEVPEQPEEPEEVPSEDITKDLNFEVPGKGTVFTDEVNLIRWTLPLNTTLDSLKLEYSSDLEEWIQIGEDFSPTRTYYLWDISELEDGNYHLRLVVETPDGQIFIKVSEEFRTNVNQDDDDDIVESSPIIINVNPENDSETTERFIVISGDLLPSEESTIDLESFEITLDESDISDSCEITEENFSCTLESELELGRHIVNAKVSDSSEKTAELEWTFTIIEEVNDDNSDSDDSTVILFGREIPRSGVILMGIILCIGGALLLIPWILYSIWSGRDEVKKETKVEETITNIDDYGVNNSYADTGYANTSSELPSIDTYSTTTSRSVSESPSIPNYDPNSTYDINNAGSDYAYTPPASDSYTNYSVGGTDYTSKSSDLGTIGSDSSTASQIYNPTPSTGTEPQIDNTFATEPILPVTPTEAPAPTTDTTITEATTTSQEVTPTPITNDGLGTIEPYASTSTQNTNTDLGDNTDNNFIEPQKS